MHACSTPAAWMGVSRDWRPWNQEKRVSSSSQGQLHRKTFQFPLSEAMHMMDGGCIVVFFLTAHASWMIQSQLAALCQDCQVFLSSLIRRLGQWLGIGITSVVTTPREEFLITNTARQ